MKSIIKYLADHKLSIPAFIFVLAVMILFLWPVSRYRLKGAGSLRVFSVEGVLLREFSSPDCGAYGIHVPYDEIPQFIRYAVVVAEDRRFFFHSGFDAAAILRSAWLNIVSRRIVSGGSTITQQLARIAYADLMPRNPFLRKTVELVLAVKLEIHCTKKEILESYINRVPMKFNQKGLPSAARRIFGRDIHFISRDEGTALIVLIRENQAPKEKFRKRYLSLAKRLWNSCPDRTGAAEGVKTIEGKIFPGTGYRYTDSSSGTLHFEDFIRSMKKDAAGDIRTSLSVNLNDAISKIITTELRFLKSYMADNCAVVVLKLPEKGVERTELVAMVGSENFYGETAGQVNGCVSIRQAGSSLKPLVYGYAMDNLGYSPYSIINDTPLVLGVNNNETYSPKNNDLRYWGPITVKEALACSRNIPAVFLVNRIGVIEFYRYLKKAGFTHMDREPDYYGPGLALGTGGVSLLHLCRIYAGIACRGVELPVYIGTDSDSDIVLGEKTVLFSEKTSYRLTHILSDREARRRAFGRRNFLDFPFDVAAKTGTSKDFRDAWTVGFTDRYVVGVWVGNFSGKQMNHVTGGWGAGRIFHQVIRLVTGRNGSFFIMPEGFRMVKFCRVSGLPAGKGCQYCMEPVDAVEKLPPACTICGNGSSYSTYYNIGDEPEIISPANGESFIIDPLMPLKDQHIPLTIFVNKLSAEGNFFYSMDDQKIMPLNKRIDRTIEPVRGKHIIKIFKEGTIIKSASFTVQ